MKITMIEIQGCDGTRSISNSSFQRWYLYEKKIEGIFEMVQGH